MRYRRRNPAPSDADRGKGPYSRYPNLKSTAPTWQDVASAKSRRSAGDSDLQVTPATSFRPSNPKEAQILHEYGKKYTDWHWSLKPRKVVHIKDSLVPDLVAIGELESFTVDGKEIPFPKGSWIGFDPKHPHERIHIIVPAAFREQMRKQMKYANPSKSLQDIAVSTRGTHAKHKLPNLQAAEIGDVENVVYHTNKGGDGPSHYVHDFGHEHAKGIVPKLAVDASGRVWLCGGSYKCPLAGITG